MTGARSRPASPWSCSSTSSTLASWPAAGP